MDRTKFNGMFEELVLLNACTVGQLRKLAEQTSLDEASRSVERLKELEKTKPQAGEVARSTAAFGALAPAGWTMSKVIGGDHPALDELRKLPKAGRTLRAVGKAVGSGLWQSKRTVAGATAAGMLTGALRPALERHLHREAEKEKLRDYLQTGEHGAMRTHLRKTLGVG
jgi:hypothetical protein